MATQSTELQNKVGSDNKVRQDVQVFLDHIAWGRQIEAEAMLIANKKLALESGNITDHAKRTFKNITGYQYAVWALDWKMWNMIQKYLTLDAITEQAKGFTQSSWVKEHAEHANWKNLIHELGEFIDNFEFRMGSWNWAKLGKHWVENVGGAQFKLPMHVLQEYITDEDNSEGRSFTDRRTDFSTEYQLRRSLPGWLDKAIKNAKFDFGILFFGNACPVQVLSLGEVTSNFFSKGVEALERGRAGWLSDETALADQIAVIKLYETRVQQRAELIASLPAKLSSAAEAEQFRKKYLADRQVGRTFRDDENNTVFHLAAKEGYVGLINNLVECVLYDAQNKMGMTPLLVAAQFGRLEMVLALLSSSPNSAIAQNDLLSVLVENQQVQILSALTTAEKQDTYNQLLINVGRFRLNNNQSDIKLMKEAAIGQMYKTAVDFKRLNMLKFLIQIHPEGLNILYKGQSPLHYAIKHKYTDGVSLLVKEGSDLALPNMHKKRALEIAEKEALDLVPYLRYEEGKLEQRNKEIALKKLEIEKNRLKFVEEFLKSFGEHALPREKAFLKNDTNLDRLKGVLTEATKEVNDNLFVSKEYHKLSVLMKVLNKMLLEKIQKKDEVIKTRITGDLFDKEKLLAVLKGVIHSPWQPRIEIKDVKKQEEVKAQRELSDNQASFCEHFEKQFDEAYSYFRALNSGEVKSIKDIEAEKNLKRLGEIAQGLPNISAPTPFGTVSIPTANVVSGILTLVQYYRENCRKAEAERIVNLFSAVTPYERTHFVRFAAEQIADMYRDQVEHLKSTSEGVEIFAQCAAARVVEYIISDDSHQTSYTPGIFLGFIHQIKSFVLNQEIPPALQKQKNLCNIFIDGILRVTSKFPKERHRLQTINSLSLGDNWCSKEIFENTGIMVLSGDRYQRYSHKDVALDRYGYCYGTIQEAERRGLSLGPSKNELWGLGRQWETVKPTLALTALPANHVQQGETLIFSAAAPNAEMAVGSQQNTMGAKLGK